MKGFYSLFYESGSNSYLQRRIQPYNIFSSYDFHLISFIRVQFQSKIELYLNVMNTRERAGEEGSMVFNLGGWNYPTF